MLAMVQNTENKEDLSTLKARKFSLWLGMIGMFMMFAALSSGFIVYTEGAAGRGIKTILPTAFLYSTLLLMVSSLTMHLAYRASRQLRFSLQKVWLLLTIALGVGFFFMQFHAWGILISRGVVFINNNASQSFIYIFTGMHLLHIFAGLLVLIRALVGVLRHIPQSRNIFRMETAAIFWHFLDILWIYIYVFLLLNQ
ncbi:cytochrome c oxidase subunit 3 [bacterium A37T11]|nr:cytochrome c oxidase subunit 3 [bacterium A37T11]